MFSTVQNNADVAANCLHCVQNIFFKVQSKTAGVQNNGDCVSVIVESVQRTFEAVTDIIESVAGIIDTVA